MRLCNITLGCGLASGLVAAQKNPLTFATSRTHRGTTTSTCLTGMVPTTDMEAPTATPTISIGPPFDCCCCGPLVRSAPNLSPRALERLEIACPRAAEIPCGGSAGVDVRCANIMCPLLVDE